MVLQNFKPDGNCDLYTTIVGLNYMLIPVTKDITVLREYLYTFIENNRSILFTGIKFRKGLNKMEQLLVRYVINTSMKKCYRRYGIPKKISTKVVQYITGYIPTLCSP